MQGVQSVVIWGRSAFPSYQIGVSGWRLRAALDTTSSWNDAVDGPIWNIESALPKLRQAISSQCIQHIYVTHRTYVARYETRIAEIPLTLIFSPWAFCMINVHMRLLSGKLTTDSADENFTSKSLSIYTHLEAVWRVIFQKGRKGIWQTPSLSPEGLPVTRNYSTALII